MELRKDYLRDHWVIIAPGRARRPKDAAERLSDKRDDKENDKCFFCPGNEHLTPQEKGRLGGEKWQMRWFDNKFPAMSPDGSPDIHKDGFFTYGSSFGVHEVIVETPVHGAQLSDLDAEDIKLLLAVYSKRIAEARSMQGVAYALMVKNQGPDAGTSLSHSHSQLMACNIQPPEVKAELDAVKGFRAEKSRCPYCDILSIESEGERLIFKDDFAVAFCPYASRFNYEAWLFPKRHTNQLEGCDDNELRSMASALKRVLTRLREIDAPYNFYLHYHDDPDFHFHIEVCPRISKLGGLELGAGIFINSVSPEEAAGFYRQKLAFRASF